MISFALTALVLAQSGPLEEQAVSSDWRVADRSVGMHLGLNGGLLGIEWQHGPMMGFVSGSAAISLIGLVGNGGHGSNLGAAAAGLGYTFALSHPGRSMWFFDVFGEVVGGWDHETSHDYVHLGLGVGIGLRFLHESGVTFGIQLPVLGGLFGGEGELGFGSGGLSSGAASTAAELFYMFGAMGTPVVSVGYRWDVR